MVTTGGARNMTLTIDLTPEQEAALLTSANAAGLDVGEYARQLLAADGDISGTSRLDEAEEAALIAMLNDLKQTGERISHNLDRMNADLKEMVATARGMH